MSMKKMLCLVLALILCGAMALAETDLDAANARIAELEAQVELYKPFYDAQVIVEYDGGVVLLDEVMEEYAYMESMYAQYGVDLASMGYDVQMKQMTAENLMQSAAQRAKAAELGLDQLDEETLAGMTAEAEANFETYVTSISSQMAAEGVTEEETREQALAYLADMGYSVEMILDSMITSYVDEQVYNYITGDVAITEEDVQATYDSLVADAEASYANDNTYNNARSSGETLVYNPEGYRQVKHVLVKFDDEQAAQYADLNDTLDTLNDELDAILNPAEETEEAAEETEEAAEETTEEPAEEVVVRTEEEVNTDIAAAQAEIDALYAALMPTAQEVIDKFNAGTPFAELIDAYGEDPGMTAEPTKTNGYAVAANSTTWDPAFTAGSMSIESVGGISEPVLGSYGIHIIYYESDITPGAVALEDVRAYVEDTALNNKISDTYTTTLADWTAALNPVYHYDRLEG